MNLHFLISLCFVQSHMQNFTTLIVNLMKREKLFASQGGPIILAQVRINFDLWLVLSRMPLSNHLAVNAFTPIINND